MLQSERVVFTGTLASMTHRQAQELVAEHGGTTTAHVSRQTTFLVIGEEGWPLEPDGQPSKNLETAQRLRAEGVPLQLVSESQWLTFLGLDDQQREVHRLYTPAMLSRLLDVPANTIRRWARQGLIKPVRSVFRLDYFEFQEVAGARRLAELLAGGVPPDELEASLLRLKESLSGTERPLMQLEMLARDARLFYRDRSSLVDVRTGQRCFDFEQTESGDESDPVDEESRETLAFPQPSRDRSADARGPGPTTVADWFQEGCYLLEQGETEGAVEAFRACVMERPADAEFHFHLAEALYRQGNVFGALERYYATVEQDHEYLEAWVQLGSVMEELGDLPSALDAFRLALQLHPQYPDAHLRCGEILHQLGRTDEAIPHWQTYLEYDQRGPWAETARQRLESAGGDDGTVR